MEPLDNALLRSMLKMYSAKEMLQGLAEAASDMADESSDNGLKDKAKELTIFAQVMEDLVVGKPFLL
jgi:hypothetical protein